MSIVSMHQSQYLPWFPYIKKIAMSDVFVVMDNVQYQKNGLQNRNKIRNRGGDFWLTIPVTGNLEDLIIEKRISDDRWRGRHWKSLQMSYSRTPFWDLYSKDFQSLYERQYETLGEANKAFFLYLIERLNIKTMIIFLSDLMVEGTKSGLVLSICSKLNASMYLSGTGGKNYLDERAFADNDISIQYITSSPVVYKQAYTDFIEGLSVVDMLFNVGGEAIMSYIQR